MAQTLSQIKAMLEQRGISPRKAWGQNFLIDDNKLTQIMETAGVRAGDRVLEVGPGTGTLTERMLEAGARVTAVDIDPHLVEILRQRIGPDREGWTLIHGDALEGKHELNPAIEAALGGRHESFKLIANLPYQIASPLLVNLATEWPGMTEAVVMVQKEVGQRLTADPGGKEYGPLGIIVRAMCEAKVAATLGPGCFWPRPQVDSVVVKLMRRAEPLTRNVDRFVAMTHTLFNKRRKQIGAILGRGRAMPEGVTETMRPEELTVTQIAWLAEHEAG